MSPRSEEYLVEARGRLAGARQNCDTGQFAIAIGAAYYAMLYAARAALSEEDLYAKTHRGTWHLFRQTFIQPGRFEVELSQPIEETREDREGADYGAVTPDRETVEAIAADAERFVAAVERMLD